MTVLKLLIIKTSDNGMLAISANTGCNTSAKRTIDINGWKPIIDVIKKNKLIVVNNTKGWSAIVKINGWTFFRKGVFDNIMTKNPALINIKKKFANPFVLSRQCGIV